MIDVDELSVSVGGRLYRAQVIEEDPWTDYYEILDDQNCAVKKFTPRMLHVFFNEPDEPEEQGMKSTIGYPGVVPLQSEGGRKGSPLTGDILWILFDLCVRQQYGFGYDSPGWKKLTKDQKRKAASEFQTFYDSKRFITNHAGIDKNFNPVSEKILGQPHRSGFGRQLEVVTVGNLVKAVSHTPREFSADTIHPETKKVVKAKTPCIQIQVWNGKTPLDPATISNRKNPETVHLATNVTPFNLKNEWSRTGPWRRNSFHFFGGKGSPYVVYSIYPQFIALNRVRRLRRSELAAWRSPFYP